MSKYKTALKDRDYILRKSKKRLTENIDKLYYDLKKEKPKSQFPFLMKSVIIDLSNEILNDVVIDNIIEKLEISERIELYEYLYKYFKDKILSEEILGPLEIRIEEFNFFQKILEDFVNLVKKSFDDNEEEIDRHYVIYKILAVNGSSLKDFISLLDKLDLQNVFNNDYYDDLIKVLERSYFGMKEKFHENKIKFGINNYNDLTDIENIFDLLVEEQDVLTVGKSIIKYKFKLGNTDEEIINYIKDNSGNKIYYYEYLIYFYRDLKKDNEKLLNTIKEAINDNKIKLKINFYEDLFNYYKDNNDYISILNEFENFKSNVNDGINSDKSEEINRAKVMFSMGDIDIFRSIIPDLLKYFHDNNDYENLKKSIEYEIYFEPYIYSYISIRKFLREEDQQFFLDKLEQRYSKIDKKDYFNFISNIRNKAFLVLLLEEKEINSEQEVSSYIESDYNKIPEEDNKFLNEINIEELLKKFSSNIEKLEEELSKE